MIILPDKVMVTSGATIFIDTRFIIVISEKAKMLNEIIVRY